MGLNEKSYGFWIVITGLVVLFGVSLVAVIKYASIGDAAGIITAAGTVIGTVVGTFFGVHIGASAGAANVAQAETARSKAENVKDIVMGGLSRVATEATPGSTTATAINDVVEAVKAAS